MSNITINPDTGEVVDGDRDQRAKHLHQVACSRRDAAWEFYAALAEIQQGELWRELGNSSFTEYVESEHDITYRYAKLMIDAAKVRGNLNHGSGLPESERVARPLTKLPADEQADAWEEVVTESETTGEKITAKKVEQVVARRVGVGDNVKPHEATKQSSETAYKRTAIELSHNPEAAAKSLVEFFPRDFLINLVEAINANLQG